MAVRARTGKLMPAEMKGGTVSITNIGSAGGMFFTPIINYPEVAIIGMYPKVEEAVLVNGAWEAHPMLHISLTFDHRIADGVMASEFLGALKRLLITPTALLGYLR
jgi:pyruvate dehydrogenase E2 component (dihydrolipoamide acetyltransferase)